MFRLVPALAFVASSLACSPVEKVCTDLFAFGLSVTVTDEVDDTNICDALVTISDGTYQEELTVQGQGADCVYIGAGERAGTYRIEASKPGYDTLVTDDVLVGEDECHVIGEQIAVELRLRTPRRG